MAQDQYHHGVRVFEINEGTRPIRTVETAIIGVVVTADDADETKFPLNKPVLLTNLQAASGLAGTTGTLKRVLDDVVDQANAAMIVVRVPEGTGGTVAEVEASETQNVIGETTAEGQYTGLKALLTAQTVLGIKPRLLGAPYLDTFAVAVEMISIAQKLRAFAYVHANASATKEEAAAYRDNFGQREVMVLWDGFTKFIDGAEQFASPVGIALGLRAKIDNEIGWHKTISNMPINGVIGVSKPIFWDLQDPTTDAGYLNAQEVTTIINHQGYRFWGSRTCSTDPLFAFENYTRTAQILADTIAEAHLWAVDLPLNPGLARDIIEGVNAKFRELKNLGYIIDGACWLDETVNTKESLKNGTLRIDYDYTPVPPLEDLQFRQRITDHYLADFAQRVAQAS